MGVVGRIAQNYTGPENAATPFRPFGGIRGIGRWLHR
jgi:hypothetical protein